VYLFGATGDHATVKRADNTSDATSAKTVGLVGVNITASNNGPVITRGYVDGIDLSVGYTAGDILWLGTNGNFTTTKPTAPNHLVFIGVVVRATSNGIVYVATQNGYELDELHNVSLPSPNSGDFLKYNGSLWVADAIDLGTDTTGNYVAGITGGTGVTVTGSGGETSTPSIAIGQAVGTGDTVAFGGLNVDSGTLYVDSTNNRVGVNDTTPSYALDVTGTTQSTQFLQGTNFLSPFHGYRNAIINGGFDVWQRSTFNYLYNSPIILTADRWYMSTASSYGNSMVSRETLAVGSISGYDAPWYLGSLNYNNAPNIFSQRIEDVRTFAGQTVTLSFWVNNNGGGTTTISSSLTQSFGSGGSTAVTTNFASTTSASVWTRRSVTLTLPSISGKTVGANSYLQLTLNTNNHYFVGFAGIQLELGSVATPFERRPLGVEQFLCDRYYQAYKGDATNINQIGFGNGYNATSVYPQVKLRQQMRVKPTAIDVSLLRVNDVTTAINVTSAVLEQSGVDGCRINCTIASGGVQYRGYGLETQASTSAILGFSAEL
jgi:hypothetical protein